jgi:phage head maturation protease
MRVVSRLIEGGEKMENERFFETHIITDAELEEGGDVNAISGLIEYGSLSQELRNRRGRFFERLIEGCFDESIRESAPDLMLEHRTQLLRREGDYFHIESFEGALCFAARMESQLGLLCLEYVANGELGVSPAFTVQEDNWIQENGKTIREVVRGTLHEVSLVRSAAYPAFRVETPERKKRIVEIKNRVWGDYPGAIAVEPVPFMVPGFSPAKQKP